MRKREGTESQTEWMAMCFSLFSLVFLRWLGTKLSREEKIENKIARNKENLSRNENEIEATRKEWKILTKLFQFSLAFLSPSVIFSLSLLFSSHFFRFAPSGFCQSHSCAISVNNWKKVTSAVSFVVRHTHTYNRWDWRKPRERQTKWQRQTLDYHRSLKMFSTKRTMQRIANGKPTNDAWKKKKWSGEKKERSGSWNDDCANWRNERKRKRTEKEQEKRILRLAKFERSEQEAFLAKTMNFFDSFLESESREREGQLKLKNEAKWDHNWLK